MIIADINKLVCQGYLLAQEPYSARNQAYRRNRTFRASSLIVKLIYRAFQATNIPIWSILLP